MIRTLLALAMAVAFAAFVSLASAEHKVTLQWDPNTEKDLEGYRVGYSFESGVSPFSAVGANEGASFIEYQVIDPDETADYYTPNTDPVEVVLTFPETIATEDVEVFFVVTAYDLEGLESAYSNEASTILPYHPYDGLPPDIVSGVSVQQYERVIEKTVTTIETITETTTTIY